MATGSAVEAALHSSRLESTPEGRTLLEKLLSAGIRVEETSEETLATMQDARSPQPVLLVIRRRDLPVSTAVAGRGSPALLVVAHGVQDPGNLGALLRTADAAGATGFVATGSGSDLFHPRAVRATMGSVFRIPCAQGDLATVLPLLRDASIRLAGTVNEGGIPYDAADYRAATALLFGGEGSGLPDPLLGDCDVKLTVPVEPGVDSLSVSAAAAVILFEARRQRRSV